MTTQVTILVVDDDEGHIELVRRNLRRAGITNPIEVVPSGRAALDFIFGPAGREGGGSRTSSDDLLILLDINMPGIDGVEVLRQVKADPEARRIPVLMLTTTDDPREIDRCYELGCNIYITKPVDPTEFMVAIQRLGLFLSVVSLPSRPPVRLEPVA
jgi:CheY-like chemotaxis protein